MPHLVILHAGLDADVDVQALCRDCADVLLAIRDEQDRQVFPSGGTRVLAYAAGHWAIADGGERGRAAGGDGNYGFMYLNLRMGLGRSAQVHSATGEALLEAARRHVAHLESKRHFGLTVQIDQSESQVFDGKFSTLHPLFT